MKAIGTVYEFDPRNIEKLEEELTRRRYGLLPTPGSKPAKPYEKDILFQEEDRSCTLCGRVIAFPNIDGTDDRAMVLPLTDGLSKILAGLNIV